jgi:hypothetical protein
MSPYRRSAPSSKLSVRNQTENLQPVLGSTDGSHSANVATNYRFRCAVGFVFQFLCSQDRSFRHPTIKKKVGGPQSLSGLGGKGRKSCPCQKSSPVVKFTASHFSDWLLLLTFTSRTTSELCRTIKQLLSKLFTRKTTVSWLNKETHLGRLLFEFLIDCLKYAFHNTNNRIHHNALCRKCLYGQH